MSNTQVLTRDAYGVTYADPSDPDFTCRFKTNRTVKSLNGVSVDNYLSEIIINDSHQVTLGTTTARDPLSVRIRTSGSIESMDRLEEILLSVATQLSAWTSENALKGFEPTTVPVNPPVA